MEVMKGMKKNRKGVMLTLLMLILFVILIGELISYVIIDTNYSNISGQSTVALSSSSFAKTLNPDIQSYLSSSLSQSLNALTYYESKPSLRKDNFINVTSGGSLEGLIDNGTIFGTAISSISNATMPQYIKTLAVSAAAQGIQLSMTKGDLNVYKCSMSCIAATYTATATIDTSEGTYIYPITSTATVHVVSVPMSLVINSTSVGNDPEGVAFNPAGTLAYVTNYGSNTISVINTTIDSVTNTITVGNSLTVGSEAIGIAVTPNGNYIYVTNSTSSNSIDNISVINTETNVVIKNIAVGIWPTGVAITPNDKLVYVTNYGSNTVSVINATTNLVVSTIIVGNEPMGIAFNPAGTLAYVTNYGSNTVSVINVKNSLVTNTIAVGKGPEGVAFNPAGTLAYVTNYGSNTVSVVDVSTDSVINTIAENGPIGMAFNPSGTLAYVTNYGSDNVSVVANLLTGLQSLNFT